MLDHPIHHAEPFPFFTAPDALDPSDLGALRGLFREALPWRRHESFYRCWMAEIGDRVDPRLLADLAARTRALTGRPLTDQVTATAQRMEPGDHALPHTDRPLVGYEVARLVVQLDEGWTPAHGGLFVVHRDPEGRETTHRIPPRANSAVGFVMTPASHHAVTPTTRTRRSVVFHFRHVGNTDAVRHLVEALFADLDFGRLPAALGPIAVASERTHPEDDTFRAAAVAWALTRWGFGPDVAIRGYLGSLGEPIGRGVDDALEVRLARWAVRLHTADFDVDAWDDVAAAVRGAPVPPALVEVVRTLCPPP